MKNALKFQRCQITRFAAVAGLVVTGMCATEIAHAEAYAFASNKITNITLFPSSGSLSFSQNSESTLTAAQWTGYPASGFTSTTFGGGASDASQATAGPGAFPVQNTFAPSMLASQGARGDAFTAAASAGSFPGISNVAEARTVDQSSGGGDGRNTGDTVFSVLLGSSSSLNVGFSYAFDTRAFTTVLGEAANASIANTFTIHDATGSVVFVAAPSIVNFDCGSASGFPVGGCANLGSGSIVATSQTLAAGTYTFDIRSTSQVSVAGVPAVPEPGTYALMLVGLGVVAFVARRKK